MRLKAIPAVVEHAMAVHPVLAVIGVAAVGFGAYQYVNNRTPATSSNDSSVASTQQGFSYGMPQVMPVDGATGMIDALTNPNQGSATDPASTSVAGAGGSTGSTTGTIANAGGLTNLDIFNFEKLKEEHDYSLATMTLAANMAIAQSNADIAAMGIQSANWTAGASLAEAFIRSGQQFVAGNVGGMTFAFLGTGTPLKFDPSQYASRNQAAMAQINAQQTSFSNLLNSSVVQSLLGNSNVQSSSGSLSVAPTGSTMFASSMPTLGGTSSSSSLSGLSASSTSAPTYDASAYQPSSYGGGGSGSTSYSKSFNYSDAEFGYA